MNPNQPSREQIESRITALLLGELPTAEAELLRWTISQDAGLQKLHDELQSTIVLVRAAVKPATAAALEKIAPAQLSDERRKKLLAHLKTPRPQPSIWLRPIVNVPRLVGVLAVLAVVAVLAAMLLPALSAAKSKGARGTYGSAHGGFSLSEKVSEFFQQDRAELADKSLTLAAAPAPMPPAAVTVPPEPALAPPPAQIVLPPTESTPEMAAQTGAAADSRSGGVYSQSVVGFNSVVQSPAPPASPAFAGDLGLVKEQRLPGISYAINADMLARRQLVEKQRADDLNQRIQSDTSSSQNAGVINSFAGGSGGFFGGERALAAKPDQSHAIGVSLQPLNQPADVEKSYDSPGPVVTAGDTFFNFQVTPNGLPPASVPAGKFSDTAENENASSDGKQPATMNSLGLATQGSEFVGRLAPAENQAGGAVKFYRKQLGEVDTTKHEVVANNTPVPVLGDVPVAGNQSATRARHALRAPVAAPAPIASPAPAGVDAFDNGGVNLVEAAKTPQQTASGTMAFDNLKTPGGSISDRSDSDELRSQSIQLKYTNPSDIQRAVQSLLPDKRSKVVANASTGELAMTGKEKEIQIAEEVVGKQDIPLQQVLVEALPTDKKGAAFQFENTNAIAMNSVVNEKVLRQANATLIQDEALPKATLPAPVPQPEILCRENNFSTFSLNVSDVSFKLAAASLEKGRMPDAASIRTEEFINAFDYRDPEAAPGQPLAFASERARYPFAHNRDLLRFSVKTAAAGRQAGRALNLVLLLDTSGSMERADRVAIIREALRVLAAQLQPQDTLSVVTFARTARLWADGVPGDKAGETLSQVGGITPEGGTNLEEAMRLAYETARRHYLANGMNRVVLLTDGAANLGNVDPGALKQKVEAQRRQGIALDCFGIGWEDFNDDLLEQLSGNGDGRYAFINSPEDAANDFAAKLAGALQVAAQDVKVQVEFNPQRVISWRQIGYAKHQLTKEQFRDNSVITAEIAAQEAGNALYTVETKPDGIGPIATIYVRYRVPGTQDVNERSWDVEYDGTAPALENSSPAMRLAAAAAAFSEWLDASPFAQEVSPDELLKDLSGIPQIYGADQRPAKLETMVREAKSIAGK